MIAIHPLHRRLAEIVHMSQRKDGTTIIGVPELQLILPLLQQNYHLVRQLDGLKELAYAVHCAGDMKWVQEICREIDALEGTMQ